MMWLLLACAPASPDLGDDPAPHDLTWHGTIAPIVSEHCASCHTDGGIAPFALDTYATAAPMASAMAGAVEAGTMPPWGATDTDTCTPRFGWKGDPRLSADETEALRAWADAGAPEGDPDDAAEVPDPPATELSGVSQTLTPDQPYVTSGDDDQYVCFSLDPGVTSTSLLTGVQVVPGNTSVVHHVLVFTDPTGASAALAGADGSYPCFGGPGAEGQLLDVWVPGAGPFETPDRSGMVVQAGSRIVMQVHYHPAGATAEDTTSIDLRWGTSWPSSITLLTLLGNAYSAATGLASDPDDRYGVPEFRIPAGSASHTEEMSVTLTGLPTVQLFMVGTHMHTVGRDMQIDLVHANPQGDEPARECLLETPAWDFNWQRFYTYDAAIGSGVEVRDGDELQLRCEYDNTGNADDVYLGESTTDEMCLGMFGIVYEL
jgi:hypothetical protein